MKHPFAQAIDATSISFSPASSCAEHDDGRHDASDLMTQASMRRIEKISGA